MCECLVHRYHVAHLCACGEIISHSQAAWDAHKFHAGMIDFDPELYKDGMTASELFDTLMVYGTDVFAPGYRAVYGYFADLQNSANS